VSDVCTVRRMLSRPTLPSKARLAASGITHTASPSLGRTRQTAHGCTHARIATATSIVHTSLRPCPAHSHDHSQHDRPPCNLCLCLLSGCSSRLVQRAPPALAPRSAIRKTSPHAPARRGGLWRAACKRACCHACASKHRPSIGLHRMSTELTSRASIFATPPNPDRRRRCPPGRPGNAAPRRREWPSTPALHPRCCPPAPSTPRS